MEPQSHVGAPLLPTIDGYRVERLLGEGGMGRVYRAYDLRRARSVALKVLRHVDPARLYLFKREFRALSHIVHPNVVLLYDLASVDGTWLLTMELIEGPTFHEQLGFLVEPADASPTVRHTEIFGQGLAPRGVRELPRGELDSARVRELFLQLASGIHAIHEAGKLHRDIKPSNVLVDARGRVVVADFGIIADLGDASLKATNGRILGTPEYMSPEQLAGGALEPASDWYSLGVMLYEVLAGAPPFAGLLARRQGARPLPARAHNPRVPADLDALCTALLEPDPAHRPRASAILRALSARREKRHDELAPPLEERALFVGRAGDIEQILARSGEVREGAPRLELVLGESGIGKTHLIDRIARDLVRDPQRLVLRGRCHERESVPYKAFDQIVDELSRRLASLPPRERDELLPADSWALARIFPVLSGPAPPTLGLAPPELEPFELRRRAFAAFRELLRRLGRGQPVVLLIDDLQWGDVESGSLLLELLRGPDAPALFVLASARSEQLDAPMLGALIDAHARPRHLQVAVRSLQALPTAEAEALARALCPELPLDCPKLARESQGLPFLLHALVHEAARSGRDGASPAPSVEHVVSRRVQGLSAPARRMLELVAVAGQTLEQPVLSLALSQPEQEPAAGRTLLNEHLIRMGGSPEQPTLECYHDRIRQAVLLALGADTLAQSHGVLARAIESTVGGDPERLLEHYRGAGDLPRAQRYALRAAEGASEALAFGRAARLYALALGLVNSEPGQRLAIQRKLGEALVYAGRTAEAAPVFMAAAEQASGPEAVELLRAAAQHALTTGQRALGLPLLKQVLTRVGLSYPSNTASTFAALLRDRASLRLSRLRVAQRRPLSVETALRADACFSAAAALAMSDPLRSAAFSARHLRLALATGDSQRVARGLAFELGVAPAVGSEGSRWATRALPVAEQLAAAGGHERALFELASGHVDYHAGRWSHACGWLRRAERSLRALSRTDVQWALLSCNVLLSCSLVLTGDLPELASRLPTFTSEAHDRGDLYRLALLAYPRVMLALAHDDVASARALTEELAALPGGPELLFRDFTLLHAKLLIDRYQGDRCATWPRIEGAWQGLRRSNLLLANVLRVTALAERGSAALDAYESARSDDDRARLRKVAHSSATKLAREPVLHAAAVAALLEARIACNQRDLPGTVQRLGQAHELAERGGMSLYVAAIALTVARLTGDGAGRRRAHAALSARGVLDVERFVGMMVPGFDCADAGSPAD